MGTRVRLLAADPALLPEARAEVERLAARLTRFDARSELCALNADPRPVVPASADLRAAVRAALAGAERTGGLADPTLLGALERAGYERSLAGRPRTPLRDALAAAPARRAAPPAPRRRVARRGRRRRGRDDRPAARPAARPRRQRQGLHRRPRRRRARARGPVRRRLRRRHARPRRARGARRASVRWRTGGRRSRSATGRSPPPASTRGCGAAAAHHLLDPATGEPAWTGVVTRHRARADRGGGRGAGQGRAARRPARRRARCCAATAACWCSTTARCSRLAA